ncbi:phosphotransferase family protein [Solimonas sp. K1W22B-7]|uniref:phosphotransferase family protein n=1 Tax=Solimonas sp. K1W22B-7 TaxID=2303331 RepID=UPI000E32FFB0|nr:phosphotransferase family protein [Solimonas sp. K1W22B-7]AXQ30123.1 phosphotransferase family protein [Solimonas sp. K1W22B-7]
MSAELAEKLPAVLARLLPGFRALQSCERLSGGASQETWRLLVEAEGGSQRYALRRAPGGVTQRAQATAGLEAEARLLTAAHTAGVPEPRVLGLLQPQDGLGAGFLMEWLDGETLGTQILRSEALATVRPRLARQCGEVLARIHAIDPDRAGLRGLLPERTPEQLVRETWVTYQGYGTPQPMIDYTARWLLDHLPPPSAQRLVHGDFRNGNLMVAPERGIVGVLDWELAQRGDPMRDLGWLCTPSWRFGRHELPVGGFGPIEELLEGYAAVAGERPSAERLHWWIVFGAFWWSMGTLMMTQFYRQGPDRSAERVAIGRRSSECQIDCVNLLLAGPVLPLAPAAAMPDMEMPRTDELLDSTTAFLREEVTAATKGRVSFLARVAANSLEIVQRELQLGAQCRAREQAGLERVLGHGGEREALRRELVEGLRSGVIALDRPGLPEHLRQSVADQVAIDQPKYPGYRTALQA